MDLQKLDKLTEAAIGVAALKNHGNMATFGAHAANARKRNQYLRRNHLGKFAKGKR